MCLIKPPIPGDSDGKESACNAGDSGSIPGLGRSTGGGHSYPLQYSCLENPMDRGAWWATVHGITKSWTRLSDFEVHIVLPVRVHGDINSMWLLIKLAHFSVSPLVLRLLCRKVMTAPLPAAHPTSLAHRSPPCSSSWLSSWGLCIYWSLAWVFFPWGLCQFFKKIIYLTVLGLSCGSHS